MPEPAARQPSGTSVRAGLRALRVALCLLAGLIPAVGAGAVQPPVAARLPGGEPGSPQPTLVEAARVNRARVNASRREHGSAPRFEDADLHALVPLPASRWAAGPSVTGRPGMVREGAGEIAGAASAEEGAADSNQTSAPLESPGEAVRSPAGRKASARNRRERAAQVRKRLLDIEVALTSLGESGLPFAQRNPNRFRSAYDAARLRAEHGDLQRELEELEESRDPLGPGS